MMALFVVFALLTIASAAAVVLLKNPIHGALALVGHLILIAASFAMLQAHFLATVQIIVYAGAIMVLVLFVLMLLNIKVEQPKPLGKGAIVVGILAAIGTMWFLVPPLNSGFKVFADPVEPLVGGAAAMGKLLYTKFVFAFEAASVLIMAAIVGAVMIAKRRYRVRGEQA